MDVLTAEVEGRVHEEGDDDACDGEDDPNKDGGQEGPAFNVPDVLFPLPLVLVVRVDLFEGVCATISCRKVFYGTISYRKVVLQQLLATKRIFATNMFAVVFSITQKCSLIRKFP